MPTGETKIVTTEFVNGFSPEQWQFCLLVVQDDYFRSLEYTKTYRAPPELVFSKNKGIVLFIASLGEVFEPLEDTNKGMRNMQDLFFGSL